MKYIFLIKYIKSVLWRVAKRLSYIEDAPCLKVKGSEYLFHHCTLYYTVDTNAFFPSITNKKQRYTISLLL